MFESDAVARKSYKEIYAAYHAFSRPRSEDAAAGVAGGDRQGLTAADDDRLDRDIGSAVAVRRQQDLGAGEILCRIELQLNGLVALYDLQHIA